VHIVFEEDETVVAIEQIVIPAAAALSKGEALRRYPVWRV
jgi:hypothetical protein